ncbi:MAG: HDIG domain-containing protein, partial [Parachlamydiaceae bacterium]|nr:HDIG domain-containing protein [Parachlamydiaceae bacterium]
MPDRSSITENEQELKFSGEQGFFDKSLVIRYLIIFAFGIVLFLFLHFREVQVETLELNSLAPGYIVSQVNFDFQDEEATVILRQNALRDLGRIYQIPQSILYQKVETFDSFLQNNQSWRNQSEEPIFNEFYQGINALEKGLMNLRLTDARTYDKLKAQGFSLKDYQVFSPNFQSEQIQLPPYVWDYLQREYLGQIENPLVSSLIIEFFKQNKWNIDEDIPTQKQLRKSIQALIPEKYTHVNAGNRIIDQGEKVTGRHVAMLHAMKKAMGENRNLNQPLTLLGTLILSILFLTVMLVYLKINQPLLLTSNRKLFLLMTILVITLGFSKLIEVLFINAKSHSIDFFEYPLFVPIAAILLCSLINPGIAIFGSGFLAVITSVALGFEWEGLLIINLSAALVAIFNTHSLRRRKEIFIVCLKAWLCAIAAIVALHFYKNNSIDFSILIDIMSAGFFMLLTAILVVGFLPLLETAFGVMTDVTLMEYMDPNNDLLRRLTIEAAGTYQHSVVVGNLAEAAALAINANGLFCRVATLYHDIGKMTTAQYFTENQVGEVNIHQLLTPKESAQVIMAHVAEGVALAREAGL